jgi:tetratricopeptide (TPR) repeat protein
MAQFVLISLMAVLLSAGGGNPQSPPANAGSASATVKRPQAKTQAEFTDYNAAYALAGGAAAEKAAADFATKYPDSELRTYLYLKAMRDYQQENNPGKILAMGEKVLSLDPDNAVALVLTSTVLADSLSDADQDRTEKIAEIKKNSTHALQVVDTSLVAPENTTPDQVVAYKSTLQAMAHSALGIMELKTGEDAGAERDLSMAADLNKTQPDPYIWYHLALAQEHLAVAMPDKKQQKKKFSEALVSVNLVLQYVNANPDLARLAQGERNRLQQAIADTGRATQNRSQETSRPQP